MRVSQLLKQLNIELPTLNKEMDCLKLPPFQLNTELSDNDSRFLIDYFHSEEMKAMNSAELEVIKCRWRLNLFFLNDKRSIEELGTLEKRLFFEWIIGYSENSFSFKKKFPLITLDSKYSEEVFVKLYDWYCSWSEKSEQEKKEIETEAEGFLTIKKCPDEESMIMNALRNGYGDVFGF